MDMPSPELKQLWIRVLKRVHPDLAIDEQDRIRCERLTKLANEAYQAGDLEALRAVLTPPQPPMYFAPGTAFAFKHLRPVAIVAVILICGGFSLYSITNSQHAVANSHSTSRSRQDSQKSSGGGGSAFPVQVVWRRDSQQDLRELESIHGRQHTCRSHCDHRVHHLARGLSSKCLPGCIKLASLAGLLLCERSAASQNIWAAGRGNQRQSERYLRLLLSAAGCSASTCSGCSAGTGKDNRAGSHFCQTLSAVHEANG